MASAPTAPSPAMSSFAPLPALQNDGGAREFLSNAKWPVALQEAFISNLVRTPLRFFICDDSGSMYTEDGKKVVVDAKGNHKFLKCSRWGELTDALKFHVGFAKAASAPTEFRLLNGPVVRVGFDPYEGPEGVNTLNEAFSQMPNGGTPLCRHIREIEAQIRGYEAQLRASNQKAVIIIATDGEASDGDVASALRPLKDLPVWVIVRLCTNEDNIVSYWNNVDGVLELNMDVIDDLSGEAQEIHKVNPWLTYGEPLHRLREFGVSIKELDIIDENLLPMEQFKRVCKLFYGDVIDTFPLPEVDLAPFLAALDKESAAKATSGVPPVWSPVEQKVRNWIDSKHVMKKYGKGGKCVIA